METVQNRLLGALVGLARATDGNEHFITPQLTQLITEALTACRPGYSSENWDILHKIAVEAKKEMVPNCFLCDHPCGRTSDFNLKELETAPMDVRQQKYRMLALAEKVAASHKIYSPALLYDALYLFGMEMESPEYLMKTIEKLEQCLT